MTFEWGVSGTIEVTAGNETSEFRIYAHVADDSASTTFTLGLDAGNAEEQVPVKPATLLNGIRSWTETNLSNAAALSTNIPNVAAVVKDFPDFPQDVGMVAETFELVATLDKNATPAMTKPEPKKFEFGIQVTAADTSSYPLWTDGPGLKKIGVRMSWTPD